MPRRPKSQARRPPIGVCARTDSARRAAPALPPRLGGWVEPSDLTCCSVASSAQHVQQEVRQRLACCGVCSKDGGGGYILQHHMHRGCRRRTYGQLACSLLYGSRCSRLRRRTHEMGQKWVALACQWQHCRSARPQGAGWKLRRVCWNHRRHGHTSEAHWCWHIDVGAAVRQPIADVVPYICARHYIAGHADQNGAVWSGVNHVEGT